jgi:predicted O-linked N-acetylglucosamine transferase (SPINDLY family)
MSSTAPPSDRTAILRQVAELVRRAAAASDAHDMAEAVRCLRQAVALEPERVTLARKLGSLLVQLDRHAEALRVLSATLRVAPRDAGLLYELSRALGGLDQLPAALRCARAALELDPHDHDVAMQLVELSLRANDAATARALVTTTEALHPARHATLHTALLCVPRVYRDEAEVRATRARYRQDLARFAAAAGTLPLEAARELFVTVGRQSNFFVHYQGQHEREDQAVYGRALATLAARLFPPLPPRGGTRARPRVAFVSHALRHHTVGKLFGRLVTGLDPARVEVYLYQLGHDQDADGARIAASAAQARTLPRAQDVAPLVEAIRADAPDVVVYTDIGMSGTISCLAATRLAPFQCVLWGHPITTGLPTIDAFVTCGAMEPDDGDDAYTERLVRLPGAGIDYARPAPLPPPTDRARIGVPEGVPLLLSCQSLYKYLPRWDDLYARIAQDVPEAVFVFLRHPDSEVTRTFEARLGAAFTARGQDFAARCRILPQMDGTAYLALNAAADVFLDTPDWSGGNTCLEAMATGLPVVTLPGTTMRARHSAAFLRRVGLDALIARDADDYVRIVTRLARDADARGEVRELLRARADGTVYGDTAPVRAFEDFLVAAAT